MKYSFITRVAAVSMLASPLLANAATVTTDAVVTILEPVQIIENQSLQFGRVFKPTAASENVIVGTDGSRTGSATLAGGTVNAADYTITSSAGETLVVTVDNITGTSADLALSDFKGSYQSGTDVALGASSANITTSSVASGNFKVGATLTMTNNVTDGQHVMTYDLTVDYQ